MSRVAKLRRGRVRLARQTGDPVGDAPHTVEGVFTLNDSDAFFANPRTCSGDGGYSDFGPGMGITVRDGSGNIIGSGRTEALPPLGEIGEQGSLLQLMIRLADGETSSCSVYFSVQVADADFYEIELGSSGELSYSREELDAEDWFISLSLGD